MSTKINLPELGKKRIVIVGGGFGGLTLARKLIKSNYQVVLLDKNNYHQFQPLFYQVAMAGLEPSSISFPFRKLFQRKKNFYFRMTEVLNVDPAAKKLHTPEGIVNYDYLVLATGADTNFFGNKAIMQHAIPMKSVSEALFLRNRILSDYEQALTCPDYEERQGLVDIVIVGGGPTGVELAGALAEMKKYILPKDYPELNIDEIDIYLVQSGTMLLQGMSDHAAKKALAALKDLGVIVKLDTLVKDYDGEWVYMNDGEKIHSKKVIWAAGVVGHPIEGLPAECIGPGKRIKVNRFSQVQGFQDIFAIGDMAYMVEPAYPKGHPQVAQTAIQQGKHLAQNLLRLEINTPFTEFSYNDLGSLATIGRNRAVADINKLKLSGPLAWYIWLVVHLRAILGVKNKLFVLFNWIWNYTTYDQSLRVIIRPKQKRGGEGTD